MKSNHFNLSSMAAAAMLIIATTAHAASGYTISKDQEAVVKAGMTMQEVKSTLGHPGREIQYRNEPGKTLTYGVVGARDTVFDIQLDAQGTVIATAERMDESGFGGHGHGGHR